MPLDTVLRSWKRNGGGEGEEEYLVSTDHALLQVDEINAAFGSDVMWWARALPRDALLHALGNSLCFGLYHVGAGAGGDAGAGECCFFLLPFVLFSFFSFLNLACLLDAGHSWHFLFPSFFISVSFHPPPTNHSSTNSRYSLSLSSASRASEWDLSCPFFCIRPSR